MTFKPGDLVWYLKVEPCTVCEPPEGVKDLWVLNHHRNCQHYVRATDLEVRSVSHPLPVGTVLKCHTTEHMVDGSPYLRKGDFYVIKSAEQFEDFTHYTIDSQCEDDHLVDNEAIDTFMVVTNLVTPNNGAYYKLYGETITVLSTQHVLNDTLSLLVECQAQDKRKFVPLQHFCANAVLLDIFVREERYVVFKLADLTESEKRVLRALQSVIDSVQQCVVVEQDWPEHELVWLLIENRSNK